MLRDGRPCEDCVGHLPWPGIVHACYRASRAQTGALVAMLVVHRGVGTWKHRVARYIALNEFCRDRFVAGGLPAAKIRVKPNSVDLPMLDEVPRSGFLFVGRLAPEKGIAVLDEAARFADVQSEIRVAGSGPEAERVRAHPRLLALGAVSSASVYEEMRRAVALVMPSLWYENYPRTLVEAFALGLPVIASRIGALATLVHEGRTGLLFEPGNPADLAAKLRWAENHPDRMAAMGLAARRRYEAELTDDANCRQLLAIYDEAVAELRPPEPSSTTETAK
jgi:glycosyltransferase involved in cell wall biosynthesis